MRTKTIAIHVKAVLSVAIPIVRNARPRIRKTPTAVRLFCFIVIESPYFKDLISAYTFGLSNKVDGSPFKVESKKATR